MTAGNGTAEKAMDAPRLTPEWRRWLVENLLRGTTPEDLVAGLERAGVPPLVAREAVDAELADPYVRGARRATGMQRKLEALLELYGDLHEQTEGASRVDRHAALPPEGFFERYYFQNLPVVLGRGAWAEAPDPEPWAPERLAERLGSGGGVPLAVMGMPVFEDARLRPLVESLRPPRGYAAEDVRACVPRLWWEPSRAKDEATGADVPEAPVSAARRNLLLGQVHGTGTVSLVPAFELPRLAGDGTDSASKPPRLEVTLAPGELLLVPVGWWFGFRAPGGGVALSFETFATAEPNVEWEPPPAEPEPTPFPRARGG